MLYIFSAGDGRLSLNDVQLMLMMRAVRVTHERDELLDVMQMNSVGR